MRGFNHESYTLIGFSESRNLQVARSEWTITDFFYSVNPKECICCYYKIKRCCRIRNLKNNNVAFVGVGCACYFVDNKIIQKFIEKASDETKSLAAKPKATAAAAEILTFWEMDFLSYLCEASGEELTPRQILCRLNIYEKFIGNMFCENCY